MKRSLKFKINLLILSLMFVLLVIILSGVGIISRNIIVKKSQNELKNYTKQIYGLLESSINITIESRLDSIKDLIDGKVRKKIILYKQGIISKEEVIKEISEIVADIKIEKSGYGYIMDFKGTYLYHPKEQGKNVAFKPYIDEILKKKNGIITYTSINKDVTGSGEKTTIYTAYEDLGIIIGLGSYKSELVKHLNLDELNLKVDSIKLGETGTAFIADKENMFIVHKTYRGMPLNSLMNSTDLENIKKSDNSFIKYKIVENGKSSTRLAYVKQFAYLNWAIAYTVTENELFADVRTLIIAVIIISIILGGLIFIAANKLSSHIAYPINHLTRNVNKFSAGHFDMDFTQKRRDEIGILSQNLEGYKTRLQEVLKSIKNKVQTIIEENNLLIITLEALAHGTEEIKGVKHLLENINSVLDNVRNQTASSQQSLAAIEEIAATNHNLNFKIKENSENLNNTLNITETCSDNLDKVNGMIVEVDNAVSTTQNEIDTLNTISKEISGILTSISGISEQTNLLALNAAIEAARAGEAGKGFSVVADEIRKLAEQTNKETNKIGALVFNIQSGVSCVKSSMNIVTTKVDGVMNEVEFLNGLISNISSYTKNNTDDIEILVTGFQEQTAATQEISNAVSSITENSVDIENSMNESGKLAKEVKEIVLINQQRVDSLNIELNNLQKELEFFRV